MTSKITKTSQDFWSKANQERLRSERDQARNDPKGLYAQVHATDAPRVEHYLGGSYAVRMEDIPSFDKILGDPSFEDFYRAAMDSPDGYAIRYNPNTGENEMFVAGTHAFLRHPIRAASDWGANILDSALYTGDKVMTYAAQKEVEEPLKYFGFHPKHKVWPYFGYFGDPKRIAFEKKLAKIANENDVKVVYGYSRGGAIAADMQLYGYEGESVGLSGAMAIAHNVDMLNLYEGPAGDEDEGNMNPLGVIDQLLGVSGTHNVHYDKSPYTPHQVWKSKHWW